MKIKICPKLHLKCLFKIILQRNVFLIRWWKSGNPLQTSACRESLGKTGTFNMKTALSITTSWTLSQMVSALLSGGMGQNSSSFLREAFWGIPKMFVLYTDGFLGEKLIKVRKLETITGKWWISEKLQGRNLMMTAGFMLHFFDHCN